MLYVDLKSFCWIINNYGEFMKLVNSGFSYKKELSNYSNLSKAIKMNRFTFDSLSQEIMS